MKRDPRDVQVWETVYVAHKWEVTKMEIKDVADRFHICAFPVCTLDFYTDEKEAKQIAKSQLEKKLENLS